MPNTAVTFTSIVSGISEEATVTWKNSEGIDVSALGSDYVVNEGIFDVDTQEQITTLEIQGDANTEDTTYTCDIIPNGGSAQSTTVSLDVFSKYRS